MLDSAAVPLMFCSPVDSRLGLDVCDVSEHSEFSLLYGHNNYTSSISAAPHCHSLFPLRQPHLPEFYLVLSCHGSTPMQKEECLLLLMSLITSAIRVSVSQPLLTMLQSSQSFTIIG